MQDSWDEKFAVWVNLTWCDHDQRIVSINFVFIIIINNVYGVMEQENCCSDQSEPDQVR